MATALNTPEAVKEYMSQATSEQDWNNRCDEVKRQNGGYPDFWFGTIVLSGLANKVAARFGRGN